MPSARATARSLKNSSVKATGDINSATRATFTYFRGDKQKFGRGAQRDRPTPTTWNQKGPTSMYKGEVNYTLSDSTFLTGRYAYTTAGSRSSRSAVRRHAALPGRQRRLARNYLLLSTDRPQQTAQLEGTSLQGRHELKFGFGWRKASVASQSGWPGGRLRDRATAIPTCDGDRRRAGPLIGNGVYWSGYVGDTITMDRLHAQPRRAVGPSGGELNRGDLGAGQPASIRLACRR